MLNECGAEELERDAVEEFFFIITDDAQKTRSGLIDVFKGKEVGESDVVD